ncbi:PH domain-containing protein [Streptomyces sp. NPDC017979]|uniref:PH domain-containing protein n=1 Tax=Streptomyces sp. NPDC017979 TaxID=3365024 RepID=UPI0037B53103
MSKPKSSEAPTHADRAYRSTSGMVGGGLLLALMAWLGGDAVFRGDGLTPVYAIAGVLFAAPLVIAFTLRPAVFANEDRVRIRNPFRTITLPWSAVGQIRAAYSTEVVSKDGAKFPMWAIPVSLRQRKRASRQQMKRERDQQQGRETELRPVQRAQADEAIDEMRDLFERYGTEQGGRREQGGQDGISVRWSYEVLAPTLAGALVLVVLSVAS